MKKHKDLLDVLRHNKMRITPARRLMLQFLLDHHTKQLSLSDITEFLNRNLQGVDRSSIYRNLEVFKALEIIQELNLPRLGKRYQYTFDKPVHHYFICKACGKLSRGNQELFERIESALEDVHGFKKSNLSLLFYGRCAGCEKKHGK